MKVLCPVPPPSSSPSDLHLSFGGESCHRIGAGVTLVLGLAWSMMGWPETLRAADVFWENENGGAFDVGANWSGGFAPGGADTAIFDLADTYQVDFTQDEETERLRLHDGVVTFDLDDAGNHWTYTLSGTVADPADPTDAGVIIGENDGDDGSLTLAGGVLNAETAILGMSPGSSGALQVGNGTVMTVENFRIGIGGAHNNRSGHGTLSVSGPGTQLNVTAQDGFDLGHYGSSTIIVEDGAEVRSQNTTFLAGLSNITVRGEDTLWESERTIVGYRHTSVVTLLIEQGGKVDFSNSLGPSNGYSRIGNNSSGAGHVIIDGVGSLLETNHHLRMGESNGQSSLIVRDGGRLEITNDARSFMIWGNGTLHGNSVDGSMVDGNVQLRGGTIMPGLPGDPGEGIPAQTGLLTLNKNLEITSFGDGGGKLLFHIRNGTDYARLHIEGDFDITTGVGDLEMVDFNDTAVGQGDSFQIISWNGNWTGQFDSITAFELDEGLFWDFSELYTDGIVSIIPEPSASILILFALGGWCLRRRKG